MPKAARTETCALASPELSQPWVDAPHLERLLSESSLPEDDRRLVRRYADRGFVVVDLGGPELDALAGELGEACRRHPDAGTRILDAWPHWPAARRLAALPRVLDLLRLLYRREPIPMQTLHFVRGSEQRAHSDTVHFSSIPRGYMCGVWVALEDVDDENGPLEYYPGSHRLPALDLSDLGLWGSRQRGYELYPRYEECVAALVETLDLKPERLVLRRGQAIVWAANLLHGGAPIRDPSRTRLSQVTHYYFENCLYYQPLRSDPAVGRIWWLDKRDVRTGRRIPQVYNGARQRRLPRGPRQRLVAAGRWLRDRLAALRGGAP